MTPTEAALLAYLQRHAGHVCTRAVLLREVWGWPDAGLTRTVDTTVCKLRKTLTGGASIETLRGLGYRYVRAG